MNHFDSFQQELHFLRNSVEDFGHAYPSIASELKLSAGQSSDPHVEQLLQSFAYLTGKLRADMELRRGDIPNQLLHGLYPSLIRSKPCMTVLQANVDTDGTNFVNGYTLAKGRQFSTKAKVTNNSKSYDCVMQCCYNTPLWPFEIEQIKILPKNYYSFIEQQKNIQTVLSVKVKSNGMDPIYEYPLDKLRFYLNNSSQRTVLYHLLNDKLSNIAIKVGGNIQILQSAKLDWLGFRSDENVLPDEDGCQRQYRLLQEYFAFADKFYFFDICGLEVGECTDSFELLFLLDEPIPAIQVNNNCMSLNCFPVINLFPKTFKPVQLKQTQYEYRLMADEQEYLMAEIHAITDVHTIAYDGTTKVVEPWLGLHQERHCSQYFINRLEPLLSPGETGCDTVLSLYDTLFNPTEPIDQTLTVKGWCNNRRLPEWLRSGNKLQPQGTAPMMNAIVVEQPTRFKGANLDPGNNIRLLSQLTLNHFALGEGEERLALLKQILTLYADPKASSHLRQINGISQWKAEPKVKRMGTDAWRGHYRGTLLTLTVEQRYFGDANPLLFAQVLSHFFALYTTLNHFVQLQVVNTEREGVWKKWPARIGEQVIL